MYMEDHYLHTSFGEMPTNSSVIFCLLLLREIICLLCCFGPCKREGHLVQIQFQRKYANKCQYSPSNYDLAVEIWDGMSLNPARKYCQITHQIKYHLTNYYLHATPHPFFLIPMSALLESQRRQLLI